MQNPRCQPSWVHRTLNYLFAETKALSWMPFLCMPPQFPAVLGRKYQKAHTVRRWGSFGKRTFRRELCSVRPPAFLCTWKAGQLPECWQNNSQMMFGVIWEKHCRTVGYSHSQYFFPNLFESYFLVPLGFCCFLGIILPSRILYSMMMGKHSVSLCSVLTELREASYIQFKFSGDWVVCGLHAWSIHSITYFWRAKYRFSYTDVAFRLHRKVWTHKARKALKTLFNDISLRSLQLLYQSGNRSQIYSFQCLSW